MERHHDAQISAGAQKYFAAVTAATIPQMARWASVQLNAAANMRTDFMYLFFPTMNFNTTTRTTAQGDARLRLTTVLDSTGSMTRTTR
jgi:hypothetical protein